MTDLGVAEKGAMVHDSPVSHASSTAEASFDRAAERRLLRKLDVRIMPVLWILYLANFIDRYVLQPSQPCDQSSLVAREVGYRTKSRYS